MLVGNEGMNTDDEYVTEKVLTILGDKDKIEEVLKNKAAADLQRMAGGAMVNQGQPQQQAAGQGQQAEGINAEA